MWFDQREGKAEQSRDETQNFRRAVYRVQASRDVAAKTSGVSEGALICLACSFTSCTSSIEKRLSTHPRFGTQTLPIGPLAVAKVKYSIHIALFTCHVITRSKMVLEIKFPIISEDRRIKGGFGHRWRIPASLPERQQPLRQASTVGRLQASRSQCSDSLTCSIDFGAPIGTLVTPTTA